jgi:hypothetical protein
MLRILHIAPEHYTGTLMTFVRTHRKLGNESRLVTLYRSWSGYGEDLCLDLPLVGNGAWLRGVKRLLRGRGRPTVFDGTIRRWGPSNRLERTLFRLRDGLWSPRIENAIARHGLLDFDIYHFESGLDLYRDARFMRRLKGMGKRIVCFYHGQDLRNRGLIPEVDRLSDLNLTCEFDLRQALPGIRYIFLPFEVDAFRPREGENERLRVCHAPTNRAFKGTDRVMAVGRRLERTCGIEFVLIENRSHEEALRMKAECDLAIDQIADGNLGYGVNSLENLALGIPTCTWLSPAYEAFLGDHPFVNASPEDLQTKLEGLIRSFQTRRDTARRGREWVERTHGATSVVRRLYGLYEDMGWVDSSGNPRSGS